MMKSTIYKLLFTGLICYQGLQAQNVGIGTNTPNASALLDLTSNNQGFLSPRMTLAQKTAIATPATGLLVYQTDGTAGFYYYDGTQWIYLGSGDWKYDGNTVGAVKSIGTNDNFDLPFETNGTEKMRLTSAGYLGIGTATPSSPLQLISNFGALQFRLQNTNSVASSGFNATNDLNNSFQVGINGSTHTVPNTAFIWQVSNNPIRFGTNNNERVRIDNAGNVGIGITTPTEKLTVYGNLFLTSAAGRNEIYGTDRNHMFVLRGDQAGTVGDMTTYYQYGGNLAAGLGHKFYTGGVVGAQTLRLQIANDGAYFTGNVGIGTIAATQRLHVAGGSILTDRAYASSTVSVVANTAAFNTGANATTQVLISDNASATANGALTYGATAIEGQYLWITNADAQSVAFQGFTIPTGKTMGFVYSGAAWREVSANQASAITASNGLNMVGTDVQLGGNLIAATTVTNNTFDLNFAGSTVTTTMDASGFIGIGTTTPLSNLHIYNNIAAAALDNFNEYQILLWQNAAAINSYGIGIRPSTMVFNSNSSYNFDVNGVTGVSIIGNNLGVGTATPTSRLDVQTTSGNFYVTDWGVTNIFARLRANNLLQGTQLRFEDPSGNWTDIGRNPAGDFQIEQNDVPHVTVLTGGNVGMGTTAPTQKLHVSGGSVLTDRAYASSTVSVAANTAAFNTGANATTQVRITDNANGAANGALTYGATAIEGQYLWITNSDAQSVAFQGFTIPTGKTMGFVYSGAAWREVSANQASVSDWILDGNSNGVIRSLGTNDAFDLPFETNGTEKMRITTGGNVGIGTTAPSGFGGKMVQITGTGNIAYVLDKTDATARKWGMVTGTGGQYIIQDMTAGVNTFWIEGGATANQLYLMSGGNVGIGTSTPQILLDVTGPGFTNGTLGIKSQINTWDHIYMNHDGSTANIIAGGADLGLSLKVGLSVTGTYGDASQAYVEGIRILRNGNVGVGISTPTAKFEVQGSANVWSGTKFAVPSGYMAGGSLTIGNTAANFGGGSGWNANTAGLMLETLDNTEIVIHDSGLRLASAMYYEGASNRITVGRDMGWGALATTAFVSNVGIGTLTPGQRLSVNGTIQAIDFGGAGTQNIQVGDDAFLTDLDLVNVMGIRSQSNTFAHLIFGSSNQGMVSGGTADYVHGAGTQNFGTGGQYAFVASQSVTGSTFGETGGFFADGNSAAIWSPGDGNGGQPAALVYFMDEDFWDGNLNPYDNTALKSYINTAGALVTVSDKNKKNSIKPISNVMDRIKQIGGYEYYFNLAPAEIQKGDKAALQSGVLAQEIKTQFPTAVEESKAGDLYVNYSALIPYLIEATKEQQQVIESLQNKIKEMELKQAQLESEVNKDSKK